MTRGARDWPCTIRYKANELSRSDTQLRFSIGAKIFANSRAAKGRQQSTCKLPKSFSSVAELMPPARRSGQAIHGTEYDKHRQGARIRRSMSLPARRTRGMMKKTGEAGAQLVGPVRRPA